jgi:hypothetical protein
MSNWISKVSAAALALTATQLVACGAPPDNQEESTAKTSEAICKVGMVCGHPPPPPPTCRHAWNALTTYSARGTTLPYQTQRQPVSHCVSTTAMDVISVAERFLMDEGCSEPIYWYSDDPNFPTENYANTEMQMCPFNTDITDYIESNLRIPYADPNDPMHVNKSMTQPADPFSPGYEANWLAHTSFTYSDAMVPPPPYLGTPQAGSYFWVMPWTDPGCMITCMGVTPQSNGQGPVTLQVPQ